MADFLELLCAQGLHDLVGSASGLASYCKRKGCDYSWEYD